LYVTCTGIILPLSSTASTVLTWVIPVCYFNYSNNKHSQTHRSVYLFCILHQFTLRLCQYMGTTLE
jgi:hypothetical protein